MTITNVLLYVALIGYVLYRKATGQAVPAPRRLFALPVVLVVLGYGDLAHGHVGTTEIAATIVGGAVALVLGALRGRADRLSLRDGAPFVRWGATSFALFAANIVVKLLIDAAVVAGGGSASAVGKSLVLTFGLTLLGEAAVIWVRTGGPALLAAPGRSLGARR